MTTAISVPDTLFEKAEQAARLRGLSRDELIAEALNYYLQAEDRLSVRERFEAVYSKQDSKLDPVLGQIQYESLPREEW